MLEEQNRHDRLIFEEWFGLFPYHIRTMLNQKAELRYSEAGQTIISKGEDGGWLAAVVSGRIRICLHSYDGREMLISMVERGEIFGERAVFDGQPRSGEAIAEENSSYLVFKREDLLPAMYDYPETMMYVIRIMCNRVVRYMNTMELYALQNLPSRLANFLIFLGQKYGREEDGKLSLQLNLSQTDLSHQIASSRESISRQMKTFAEEGLIEMDSGTITITNLAGLKKVCHLPE